MFLSASSIFFPSFSCRNRRVTVGVRTESLIDRIVEAKDAQGIAMPYKFFLVPILSVTQE